LFIRVLMRSFFLVHHYCNTTVQVSSDFPMRAMLKTHAEIHTNRELFG
jgi:hypothetical protein